jgi:hypothetical protein
MARKVKDHSITEGTTRPSADRIHHVRQPSGAWDKFRGANEYLGRHPAGSAEAGALDEELDGLPRGVDKKR